MTIHPLLNICWNVSNYPPCFVVVVVLLLLHLLKTIFFFSVGALDEFNRISQVFFLNSVHSRFHLVYWDFYFTVVFLPSFPVVVLYYPVLFYRCSSFTPLRILNIFFLLYHPFPEECSSHLYFELRSTGSSSRMFLVAVFHCLVPPFHVRSVGSVLSTADQDALSTDSTQPLVDPTSDPASETAANPGPIPTSLFHPGNLQWELQLSKMLPSSLLLTAFQVPLGCPLCPLPSLGATINHLNRVFS